MKTYAGIGSRKTPENILKIMRTFGHDMAEYGYVLRSGAADGADTAFEEGCDEFGGEKEIFLPWKGFNGSDSTFHEVHENAYEIARKHHPAWNRLSSAAKKLHGRNTYQILGWNCDDPVDVVVCWTPSGKRSGTEQALRIARTYNIPIYNLSDADMIGRFYKDYIPF